MTTSVLPYVIPETVVVSSSETWRDRTSLEVASSQRAPAEDGIRDPFVPVVEEIWVSAAPAVNVPKSAPEEIAPDAIAVEEEVRSEEVHEVPSGQDQSAEDEIMGEVSGNHHFVNFQYDESRPLRDDRDKLIQWAWAVKPQPRAGTLVKDLDEKVMVNNALYFFGKVACVASFFLI